MQARRQRRPTQTPTMMPVTECTSKESGRGQRGDRTGQGQDKVQDSKLRISVASSGDDWPESHPVDTQNLLLQEGIHRYSPSLTVLTTGHRKFWSLSVNLASP